MWDIDRVSSAEFRTGLEKLTKFYLEEPETNAFRSHSNFEGSVRMTVAIS